MAPKPAQRRNLVYDFLRRHQSISRELVDTAYDSADAAFQQAWYGQNVTWSVRERIEFLLKGLRRELPAAELDELVHLHEDMELAVRPDIAPGIADALADLHGKYKLAVISDAIFSPGRALRELLSGYGLLGYFDAFAFSDEVGRSKPEPVLFETVAGELGIELSEIVHVGDREQKDVDGAHAVGARAVLATVVKDHGVADTKAEAVCSDYRQLAAIIEDLGFA